jgi:two-component system, OmpR family, phosphate regulon sensor histidine kinase PhoR
VIADFLSALPDGALVVSREGQITSSNSAAREILQLAPDGLLATTVIRSATFSQALAGVRTSHRPATIEFEIHSRPPRLINAHIATFGADDALVILRDLTREQAIEKMRSDFVANASHEMRTPLASIIGAIETLQGPAKNDAKGREMFLGTMLTQAQRMKRLIDDLLTLSRIELNAHVRPSAKVSLLQIAKQAKSNLQHLSKDLEVEVSIQGEGEVFVAGDGEELLQVAQNLLENALKYGASGKRVVLACLADGDSGTLAIQDFGKGIPEIHLPRLTERFYRVSTQESRQRGGTGLGLAIVKHILLRHRSKLDVQSAEGRGSTFSFQIPLYKS